MNGGIIFVEISKGKMAQSLLVLNTCSGGLSARLKEKKLVSLTPEKSVHPAW